MHPRQLQGQQYFSTVQQQFFNAQQQFARPQQQQTDLHLQQWMHPPPGYVKCNVDVSFYDTTEATGWELCVRDHQGRFMIVETNIMYAKLNTIEGEAMVIEEATEEMIQRDGINEVPHSPTLNEEAYRSLTNQITKEEVTHALNQMHPFKAPGGYPLYEEKQKEKGDMVFKIDLEKAYDNSQALNTASTLKRFTDYSGLKVNINKSKVFLSSTTRSGKISSIVSSTCINRTLSLEKYLGFPMMHGSSDTGIHLVGWDKITKPKKLGGLGIRKARDANTSLLGKKALSALKEGFHFHLGNDNSSFWYSNWSGNGVIANHVMFVYIHDLEMRVRDVYIDGNWQFNQLYTNLPQEIKEKLNSTTISLNPSINDCYTWKGNLNGIYTVRDGYYWLNRNSFSANATRVASWSWLWHVSAPEKIKFFLWTMLHNSLPTREMLSHRGFSDQNFFQGDDSYDWLRNDLHTSQLRFVITPITKLVKWNALGGTGMLLNVDGNSIGNPGISDFGGLIRNADGAYGNLQRATPALTTYLAKHGANNTEVYSSIAIPPASLNLSLLADASGT
ncbi:hypothetical protein TSUD_82850 [Trifolium subterraneum]|uniref:Reverse transcriptase zinc-binding domain-containing protein n=1 Tax=Trifolium subterraneum TaxID=3900 RepID=A0A2Z6LL80_TRISU|nr:hypothetical protein TSUD_82850 [Trifolium subterraneum]